MPPGRTGGAADDAVGVDISEKDMPGTCCGLGSCGIGLVIQIEPAPRILGELPHDRRSVFADVDHGENAIRGKILDQALLIETDNVIGKAFEAVKGAA